LLKTAK